MARSDLGFIIVAGLLCGCDIDVVSKSGRLAFDVPDFHYSQQRRWHSGQPIAVGSEVCFEHEGWFDTELGAFHEDALTGCFDIVGLGVGQLEGRCLLLDDPGDAVVSFVRTSASCPGDLPDDAVEIRAVALAQTQTAIDFFMEDRLETPGWTLEQLAPASGETLAVVEGVGVTLMATLRTMDTDEHTAWTHGRLSATTTVSAPQDGGMVISVQLSPGQVGQLELSVAEEAAPVALLEAVPVASLRDFAIVSLIWPESPYRPAEVMVLRAFARDEAGRPVRGVPAQWRVVQGDIELRPLELTLDPDYDPDYVAVEGPCHEGEDPIEQMVIVEAELEGEVRSVAWTYVSSACLPDVPEPPPVADDDGGIADEDASRGCACSASDTGDHSLAWTWLGLVGGVLRRRPSRRIG